ncbi:nucleolar MIF4G domain-containing protein 1 isoform X2 [Lycorma delicatula]
MGKFKDVGKRQSNKKKQLFKSRKQLRKDKRKAKKERKNEHYKKKFQNININNNNNNRKNSEIKNEKKGSRRKPIEKEMQNLVVPRNRTTHSIKNTSNIKPSSFEIQLLSHKDEINLQNKLENDMKVQRKKQLFQENKNEDKVIKKLEKQLRLNKRKSKTLPQSFMDEGLDYLLDVCDSTKIKDAAEAEKNLQGSDSEFEEDFEVISRNKKKKIKKIEDETNDSNVSDSASEMSNGDNSSDNEDLDDDDNFDDSDSENEKSLQIHFKVNKMSNSDTCSDNDEVFDKSLLSDEEVVEEDDGGKNKSEGASEVYEDIYGRKRDKDGNLVPISVKYIPPQLKAQQNNTDGKEELLGRLKKQIKGLLNRLAENNMHRILSEMDQLYMQNSRNDMNETLVKLIFESLIQPNLIPDRLIIEHTMIIAALHANIGTEVGAHFLQAVVEKFVSLYGCNSDVTNKEVDNTILIIAHLYSFKVFNCVLMYDILNHLTETAELGEKEVELLLIVLREVGFSLRKDDPSALKNLIMKVQSTVSKSVELIKQPRVKFMLDVLIGIKNNNISKIPNYDLSKIEHHKKLLKSLVHKGKYISELNITLEDLLKAPERGRWWVVGSAWTGGDVSKSNSNSNIIKDVDDFYIKLAKKHRMSTDTRRNIFCILMSAEDYMDAFEKLLRLGLKGPQEQTILHILVHCVLQEKTFNPYYAYLSVQFSSADRKYQMALQYHLWDRIRELSDLKGFQITNLALFLSHLILEKALPLSVLKVVEFASLSKPYVRLLRQIFLTILLNSNEEVIADIFQRISRTPKLSIFRESVRLFFHHFILRNISENSNDMTKLKERVKFVENCMNFV